MASNLEALSSSPECGNLNFRQPRHTSSPNTADFTANTLLTLNELNTNESQPITMAATGGSALTQTNKKDGGSRTSPSKPKYNLMTKKTNKSSLQNKNSDEVYTELLELKKVNSSLGDENASLKNKLRRSEEEQTKRSEIEKTANNMLVSNLKRKAQRLEETLKEKDSTLKILQNEARMAKHEAKIAIDRQDSITKKAMTGLKDIPKSQKSSVSSSRSPGSRSAEARSPTKSLILVDENKQLREKLRKALSIRDPSLIENYKDLSSDELISKILHYKAEIEVLQKIKTRIEEDNQNGFVDIEVEKLNSEIQHLKKDRLSYFEESERKELEIKNLKEELEQIRKEVGKHRLTYGAIPKVPSQLSQNIEAKNKARSKSEVLKKSSTATTPSFESSAKRTITISKPKAASASTTKSSAAPAATVSNGVAAKSKLKTTKDGMSPVRNGHSTMLAAAGTPKTRNASPKKSPKERIDVEKFRQNVAAKKIQQSWKIHRSDVVENGTKTEVKLVKVEGNSNGVENKLINFEGNNEDELNTLHEAVTTIQSVARGNEVRSELLNDDGDGTFGETANKTMDETKERMMQSNETTKHVDDSVTTIQSVARAHHHREEILKTWETNRDQIVLTTNEADLNGLKMETNE